MEGIIDLEKAKQLIELEDKKIQEDCIESFKIVLENIKLKGYEVVPVGQFISNNMQTGFQLIKIK